MINDSKSCLAVFAVSTDEDSEDSSDGLTLTLTQKESIEQKRKKAEELRASKRPLSHEPGTYGPFTISLCFLEYFHALNI